MSSMKTRYRLLLLVILPLLFFSSCKVKDTEEYYSFDSNIQKEEVEKFLRNLLFWRGGIYTLLGSKPVTTFDVVSYSELDDQSIINYIETSQNSRVFLNSSKKKDVGLYKSLTKAQKTKAFVFGNSDYIFDDFDLWKDWEVFCKDFHVSKKYLLFKQKFSKSERENLGLECEEAYHIAFVNVLQTTYILEKYYDKFREVLGYDFDPLEEVLKMQNEQTAFWDYFFGEKACNHHLLCGLLYGYGWENAFTFHMKNTKHVDKDNKDKTRVFFDQLTFSSKDDQLDIIQKEHPFSINNFPLPGFISFPTYDQTLEKYKNERSLIQSFYEGKDFLQTTLKVLSEKGPLF